MIFSMTEKSTFDKNGIKRHEVAYEFLTLISFQSVCDIQTGLSGENEAGVNLLPMTSTFYKANTLSNTSVTSMFSRIFSLQKAEFDLFTARSRKHIRPKIHL